MNAQLDRLKQEQYRLQQKQLKYIKENKLEFYDPYDFQVEFHNDPDPRKALEAGNQIGKTMGTCAEDAFDLTGLYPEWWEGLKYDRPIHLVCGGVNNDKTRDLLQKGLFGDPVIWEEALGTGFVPKKCIGKISKKRGVSDAFLHVKVKHFTQGIFDGWSTVSFQSYESGKAAWMGDTIDVFHLDEEPPMDILEQAGRGCIASGGRIRCSYTPENGQTEVVRKIKAEWSLHKAGWPDVAGEDFEFEVEGEIIPFRTVYTMNGRKGHLTQQKVVDASKNFAPYQMKMRVKGIPVLGSGLVFEYAEETIKVAPLEGGIPDNWPRIGAVDFGGISKKSHPSAVVYIAYDEDNDVAYIYDCIRLYSAEIADVAARMLARPDWIPVMWPHDGNKEVPGGSTVALEYQKYGVNMFWTHFTNPPDENQPEGKGGIKIEPGIIAMSNRIKDRRLRVYNTLPEWFEEYRQYHVLDGKIVDRDDDLMAATRIGIQSLRHAIKASDIEDYEFEEFDEDLPDAETGY